MLMSIYDALGKPRASGDDPDVSAVVESAQL